MNYYCKSYLDLNYIFNSTPNVRLITEVRKESNNCLIGFFSTACSINTYCVCTDRLFVCNIVARTNMVYGRDRTNDSLIDNFNDLNKKFNSLNTNIKCALKKVFELHYSSYCEWSLYWKTHETENNKFINLDNIINPYIKNISTEYDNIYNKIEKIKEQNNTDTISKNTIIVNSTRKYIIKALMKNSNGLNEFINGNFYDIAEENGNYITIFNDNKEKRTINKNRINILPVFIEKP